MKTLENIYFIGIGGIGMSALARYFIADGKHVAGYDKTPSNVTDDLQGLGANIHFDDSVDCIKENYLDATKTLVVYTPAIPNEHRELNYFKTNGFRVLKRSEVLGLITKNTTCLAVSGTHGKTTTTSILGHLLKVCDVNMTAFLGGVSENYNSNLIQNGAEVSVVEADEFDRSFLTLSPDYACITSMDADHLDIYGEKSALEESFRDFINNIKPNGKLFVKKGLPVKGWTYAVEEDADYKAVNVRIAEGTYVFDVVTPTQEIKDVTFGLPGRHNLSNALIALVMALEFGCDAFNLVKALASYKGVKRRFTYEIKTKKMVFIDDYAHHPEEINAVYQAVKEMYPEDKCVVVFQPHLFSRTRDFVDEFAKSLAQFDEVLLLDIYPARELPIKGVDAQWLLGKIENPNKKLILKSEIVSELKNSASKIILTLGAGDIGMEVNRIKKELSIAN